MRKTDWRLPTAHLAPQPAQHCAAQPAQRLSSTFCQKARQLRGERTPELRQLLLAAFCFPLASGDATHLPASLSHSPALSPPSWISLCSAPEYPAARRKAPPQPRPSPSPTTVTNSSARTRSISSTSHASRVSPQHRHRCLLQPRDRRPSPSNSSAPDRPRPHRASRRHRCEPLTTYPLLPSSN